MSAAPGVTKHIKKSSLPIRLLMEAKQTVIACMTVRGEIYWGLCTDIQESLNIRMSTVTLTKRNGTVMQLDEVYLRGSQIKFVALRDELRVRYEAELAKVLAAHEEREKEKKRIRN